MMDEPFNSSLNDPKIYIRFGSIYIQSDILGDGTQHRYDKKTQLPSSSNQLSLFLSFLAPAQLSRKITLL
jgi:hypothetical protein